MHLMKVENDFLFKRIVDKLRYFVTERFSSRLLLCWWMVSSIELPVKFVQAQTQIHRLYQAKPQSPSLDLCSSLLLRGQLATQVA